MYFFSLQGTGEDRHDESNAALLSYLQSVRYFAETRPLLLLSGEVVNATERRTNVCWLPHQNLKIDHDLTNLIASKIDLFR